MATLSVEGVETQVELKQSFCQLSVAADAVAADAVAADAVAADVDDSAMPKEFLQLRRVYLGDLPEVDWRTARKIERKQAQLETTGEPAAGGPKELTEPKFETIESQQQRSRPAKPDPKEKRYDDGEGPFSFAEFEEYYGEAEARKRWLMGRKAE